MRGDIAYKILGFLEDRGADVVDLMETFLESGYGATVGKIDYKYGLKQQKRQALKFERDKKRNLQKYIFKLRSDGLIVNDSSQKIYLSVKGKKKLESLKKNKIFDESLYKRENGDEVIIVSYDIPVLFNRERDGLRNVLKVLGFKMVHKSVWVGKVKLPEQFISMLEKCGILEYVEILKVTKRGSLQSV